MLNLQSYFSYMNRLPLLFQHNKGYNLLINSLFHIFKFGNVIKKKNYSKPTARTDSLKIVSHTHKFKFIYIGIPLCATRQMTQVLLNNQFIDLGTYAYKKDIKDLFQENNEYKNYYKFTIVRNPWSRVVSCYNRKILNANTLAKINLISRYNGLYPQMSFKDFVIWLCSEAGQDEYADKHWISQHKLLPSEEKPNYGCDYIGHLENLKRDLQRIFEHIGITHDILSIVAKSPQNKLPISPKKESYRDYFNSKLIDMIAERYEKDIKLLNYEF